MSEPESECNINTSSNQNHPDDSKPEIDVSDSTPNANDSIRSDNHPNDVTETSMSEAPREECSAAKETSKIDADELVATPEHQVDPIDLYRKLEIIKEIKNKTVYLQRIKTRISQEVDCIESETKSLGDYKTELELLVQEEKAHLEELRQIQNDIAVMEATIKQTNEEKIRALDSAKRLHYEYKPLKEQINHLRDSIGLEKTDDNDDETLIDSFLRKLTPITEKPKSGHNREKSKSNAENRSKKTPNTTEYYKKEKEESTHLSKQHQNTNQLTQKVELPVQLATAALMAHSLRSISPTSLSQQQQQHFQQHFNPFILNQVNMNNEKYKNLTTNNNNNNNNEQLYQQHQQQNQIQQQNNTIQHRQQQQQQHLQSLPAPFRQQPPPMKTCMSCNQQIHRNAPICPLCKAKSRSTNPKKPKKKVAETSPNSIKS